MRYGPPGHPYVKSRILDFGVRGGKKLVKEVVIMTDLVEISPGEGQQQSHWYSLAQWGALHLNEERIPN